MPTQIIAKQSVYYELWGASAAPPALVLIHGAGGSHEDWPEAIRRLPHTAVYALDLPGHGRSAPPGYDTIDAYANAVQAWLEACGLTAVVLAGHSMGSAIVQTLALRYLPVLRGIILAGASARLRVSPIVLDNLPHDPATAVSFVAQYAWSKHAPPQTKTAAVARLAGTDSSVLHGDYLACNRFDRVGQLHPIRIPTLIISGAEDQMTPTKYGRSLAAEISQSEYVEIGRAGHYVMLEQPQVTAEAMRLFLRRLQK